LLELRVLLTEKRPQRAKALMVSADAPQPRAKVGPSADLYKEIHHLLGRHLELPFQERNRMGIVRKNQCDNRPGSLTASLEQSSPGVALHLNPGF
jgi:hypothetical protein